MRGSRFSKVDSMQANLGSQLTRVQLPVPKVSSALAGYASWLSEGDTTLCSPSPILKHVYACRRWRNI